MAIDASIPLQIRPIEDPISQYSKLAQLQNMQTQGKLADAQLQGQQRAVERQNKLSQLLSGQYATPDAREQALLQGGFADESLKLGKDRRENVKLDADTGAKKQETGIKANEAIGQTLGALMRIPGVGPQQIAASMQQLVDAGVLPAELAQKIVAGVPQDPAQIPAFLQMGRDRVMSAKEQRSYTDVDANTTANNQTSRANNAASIGIQRDRLNFDKEKDKRDGSAGGKAPAGYRFKPDGSLEAIPGGPAAGKSATATEGERKAATLLKRLEGSQAQLNAALKENPDAAKPGVIASGMRSVGAEALANTTAVGSERQRIEAAQLDMLDAALTLGTGAAYTREQLEGYRKSYFPQIGDTEANVKDKKARLKNVIDAAKIAAGRAGPQGGSGGATGGWDGGDDPLGLRK